ncbi:hypothetical protein [Salinigranum sp.]|uniref:hypothetical protein n=1 Tax=Salinigranum sp. TaxID=1966351 RepID=UPI003562DE30
MALALAPVVFAEDLFEDDPDDLGEWFWWLFDRALLLYGQLGVAVLSRGREWAADAGAAALTGSPAALASALVRLDEARGPPPEDLREWSDALVALDVLPTLSWRSTSSRRSRPTGRSEAGRSGLTRRPTPASHGCGDSRPNWNGSDDPTEEG